MAKVSIYNLKGEKVEKLDLSDVVFGVKNNDDLIHQILTATTANQRKTLAHTKNRGERAGSGIKPWRQKGTGRARVGSVRTPVWKKGGVVFGPRKDRNFSQKINKKMNTLAIKMVLSGKLKDEEMIIVDKLEITEKKTKFMATAMKKLKIKGKTLIAFSEKEKQERLFSRNLEKVKNILTNQLNVADMLNNKYLLMSKESVKYLEKKYNNA
jgi:large subunit ribosomal protein L4